MRIVKVLAGILVVLLIAIVGIAVYIANLDANEYRGEIAAQAKAATGRDLVIAGNMDFEVSLTPALVVEDVSLSNADWGSEDSMLRLKRLEVKVGLLPLLSGNIDVHRVILVEPVIVLETDKNGRGNWEFEAGGEPTAGTPAPSSDDGPAGATALPSIGELRIENGRVLFKDGVSGQVTTVAPLELKGRAKSPSEPLELSLNATVNDIPISLVGEIGPLAALLDGSSRATLDMTAEALGLKISARGTMAAPNIDAAIDVSASDLAGLKPLAGDGIPTGQALKLSGQLAAGPDAVKLSGLSLTLGESDLSGDVTVTLTGARPKLDATLQSRQLNLAALMPQGEGGSRAGDQGGASGGGQDSARPGKVFPNDPLPLDALKAVDADVKLAVARLLLPELELAETNASILLQNGRLTLTPLNTRITGSPLEATVELDGSAGPAKLSIDMKAMQFDVGRLLKETGATDLLEGSGDIAVNLKGQGDSVAAIMASLNGSTSVLMGQGRMRTQAFDTLIGGLSAVMGSLFSEKSEWTVVNCVANRFDIKQGIATSQVMLFDTEYSTVVGKGDVNLGDETLGLTVTPQSKSPTLNLSVPVKVGGTLAEPTFRPDELAVARRVGGLLGSTLFPPAALLSLGDLGSGDDNPCLKIASGEAKPADSGAAAGGSGSPVEAPKKAIEEVGKGLKKLFGN